MSDHVLHLGHCANGLPGLADGSVGTCLMDPPYSERVHGRLGKEGRSDGVASREALTFEPLDAAEARVVSRELARVATRWIIVFCDELSLAVWVEALEGAGCEYVRKGTWVKDDQMPQMSGDRPSPGTEEIVIAHAPRPTGVRLRWSGGGKPAVYRGNAQERGVERVHPAQKPQWLLGALLRDFTDVGEMVVDPYAGSGTTGFMCKRLGRRFVGWEKDPKVHAAAVKRIEAARQQYELLPRGPKPKQTGLFASNAAAPDSEDAA
jgi:DNA modification methylase